ncbi:MAG TPA: hypothetical protein VJJ77_07945 [Dongiaceae bacterium]|nr:hypothetical protein [Dongiaceae bacterium]
MENIERIEAYTAGMNRETFAADKRTARATVQRIRHKGSEQR